MLKFREFHEAWKAAKYNIYHEGPGIRTEEVAFESSKFLANQLGIDYPAEGHWRSIRNTEELLPILRLLAGPYWQAILKTYRIQRGLE